MTRIITLNILLFLILPKAQVYSNNNFHSDDTLKKSHCYFENTSISIGSGTGLNLQNSASYINPRLYYNPTKNICFGPEYAFSKKSHEFESHEINLVVHYIIEAPIVGLYPVLGANYTTSKEHKQQINEYGLLTGLGLHRMHKRFIFFLEYNHLFYQEKNEGKIGTGFFYNINFN